MLHLSAALQSAVTGRTDRSRTHLTEAAETADHTGDGTFAGLNFGPRNVGAWRVVLALELGEPGRVVELARNVDVAAITSAGRQAASYGDVGRGLATVCGLEAQAVEALHRGPVGFANVVVSKRGGEIVFDPHVTGACVLTLADGEAIALRDALTRWLG